MIGVDLGEEIMVTTVVIVLVELLGYREERGRGAHGSGPACTLASAVSSDLRGLGIGVLLTDSLVTADSLRVSGSSCSYTDNGVILRRANGVPGLDLGIGTGALKCAASLVTIHRGDRGGQACWTVSPGGPSMGRVGFWADSRPDRRPSLAVGLTAAAPSRASSSALAAS